MPLTQTQFSLPGQTSIYKGKVRDVYNISDQLLVMVVTDRISAFDVILPAGIPYKGQVLNQIATQFMDTTADIVANWKIATPHPMVTIGHICEPYKVEMVIRGYLTGHAWRLYKAGKREICGVPMPDGMIENQAFEQPIITPTTKAMDGAHDQDISKEEIIARGIVTEAEYLQLESYTHQLFERGTQLAAKKDLILVDTKYEFGKKDGKIYLIDEIHTPDSSRYFYRDNYYDLLKKGQPQKQLSKEFVREWLMENGFSGQTGQTMPEFTPIIIKDISDRYIELFEKLTGNSFERTNQDNIHKLIEKSCIDFLESFTS